jgi:hypothetical protein
MSPGAKFNDLTPSWKVAGPNVYRVNVTASKKPAGILTTFIFLVLTEPMMVILVSV